ncbi:hypothetical protein CBL_20406 [Carabus blaptoides fortunei]
MNLLKTPAKSCNNELSINLIKSRNNKTGENQIQQQSENDTLDYSELDNSLVTTQENNSIRSSMTSLSFSSDDVSTRLITTDILDRASEPTGLENTHSVQETKIDDITEPEGPEDTEGDLVGEYSDQETKTDENIEPGDSEDASYDQVGEYLYNITQDIREHQIKTIIKEILNKVEGQKNINILYDLIVTQQINNKSKNNNSNVKNNSSLNSAHNNKQQAKHKKGKSKKNPAFRETARTNIYIIYNKLFDENKQRLAELIWQNEEPKQTTERPKISDIEEEYGRIYAQPAMADNAIITEMNYGMDTRYSPITIVQLGVEVQNTKKSAPGVDHITKTQVSKLDLNLLTNLFNAILYAGVIPDILRKCRTTLIPKGGDLTQINNWRPITIGSCILRILNKIIAARLSRLKLHHAQKGFRNIDGCLANFLLVHNTIKEHREAAQPFNIVKVDLRKAFDSVHHDSIRRALGYPGNHKQADDIFKQQRSAGESGQVHGSNSTEGASVEETKSAGDLFKYLGKNFGGRGIQKLNSSAILRGLGNLQRAAQKPQQKLVLLKFYFIPRLIHDLQCPGITARTLNAIDMRVRSVTKKNEPHVRCESGILQKPDLIFTKDETVIICEVGIHWEGPNSLEVAYNNKIATYNTPGFLQVIQKQYHTSHIQIHAFITGARGIWCPNNKCIVSLLQLTNMQMNTITTDTIRGSVEIHSDFGSRVWTGSTCRAKTNPTPNC